MLSTELEGLLNAHAFLQVERPPALWAPEVDLEPFVRLLGEMIAAALVRNGQELAEVTLNVANVTVEADAAGGIPEGDFVAVTIRSRGDWSPETSWHPRDEPRPTLVSPDLQSAAVAAGAAYGYTRSSGDGEGSVTVFFRRAAAD
jgi:hypothetical protein